MSNRKLLIAANWKMYKTPEDVLAFSRVFNTLAVKYPRADMVLCASPSLLATLIASLGAGNPIFAGAQDMHWLDQGAYTGETSPLMLKALGVTHVQTQVPGFYDIAPLEAFAERILPAAAEL